MLVLEIAAGILLAFIILENAEALGNLLAKVAVIVALCSPVVLFLAWGYVVSGVLYMCALGVGLATYAFIRSHKPTSSAS